MQNLPTGRQVAKRFSPFAIRHLNKNPEHFCSGSGSPFRYFAVSLPILWHRLELNQWVFYSDNFYLCDNYFFHY